MDDLYEKLLSNSSVNHNSGCIEWNGALSKKGYGHINWKGRVLRVHKASYTAKYGDVPNGYFVCHKCDNRKCFNPEHLYLGTPLENSRDMVKKNRQTIGEKNPMAKLTESDVMKIRKLRNDGLFMREIAELFNVSREAVGMIVRSKRWANV